MIFCLTDWQSDWFLVRRQTFPKGARLHRLTKLQSDPPLIQGSGGVRCATLRQWGPEQSDKVPAANAVLFIPSAKIATDADVCWLPVFFCISLCFCLTVEPVEPTLATGLLINRLIDWLITGISGSECANGRRLFTDAGWRWIRATLDLLPAAARHTNRTDSGMTVVIFFWLSLSICCSTAEMYSSWCIQRTNYNVESRNIIAFIKDTFKLYNLLSLHIP